MARNCLRCNPKAITGEPEYHGFYSGSVGEGRCTSCGAKEGRKVIRRLHPRINGKRGRNSGKVNSKSKKG